MSDDRSQSRDSPATEKEEEVITKTNATPAGVFDSSKYDSMKEMRESPTMDENETKKIVENTDKLESINPQTTRIETTDKNNNANTPTVDQTMEGRASAVKQSRQNKSKGRQNTRQKEEMSLPDISKKLDKQQNQIGKIIQMLQPVQKQIKFLEKQPASIKHIQSQIKEIQKQISQIQKTITKKR
jgi:hypothetical protein